MYRGHRKPHNLDMSAENFPLRTTRSSGFGYLPDTPTRAELLDMPLTGPDGRASKATKSPDKKKTLRQRSSEIAEKLINDGISPLEIIMAAARDAYDRNDMEFAAECASKAAPFLHPRLANVEVTGADGAQIAAPTFNISFAGSVTSASVAAPALIKAADSEEIDSFDDLSGTE